jgi:hypothetical protein
MASSYRTAGESAAPRPHGSDHRCEATTGPWARAIGLCWCLAYLRQTNALALLLTTSTAASLALDTQGCRPCTPELLCVSQARGFDCTV